MRRSFIVCITFLMFGVGCATMPSPAPEPLCLPPGVSPAFLAWPVVIAVPGAIQGVGVFMVGYQQGDQKTLVMWQGDRLVYVDPEPDGNAPPWRRLSDACHWSQGPRERT